MPADKPFKWNLLGLFFLNFIPLLAGDHVPLAVFPVIERRDLSTFLYLVQRKEQRECRNAQGDTPLLFAVRENWQPAVVELIKRSVDLNQLDCKGRTALMIAAFDGHEALVASLLHGKLNLDLQDKEGKTALCHAAERGKEQVVKLLLEANANPRLRSLSGESAADLAKKGQHWEIFRLLLQRSEKFTEYYQGQLILLRQARNKAISLKVEQDPKEPLKSEGSPVQNLISDQWLDQALFMSETQGAFNEERLKDLLRASRLLGKGERLNALPILEKLLANEPEQHPHLAFLLARNYLALGQNERALDLIDLCVNRFTTPMERALAISYRVAILLPKSGPDTWSLIDRQLSEAHHLGNGQIGLVYLEWAKLELKRQSPNALAKAVLELGLENLPNGLWCGEMSQMLHNLEKGN